MEYKGESIVRIIDPPRKAFEQLSTPLTDGERKMIELFDQHLSAEWEFYVHPHLNGLRPDIVLLHPGVGVAVFEVKDWDLGAMQYSSKKDLDGQYVLVAGDQNGRHVLREADNLINQILRYREEIFELYCPRLDDRARAVITTGLVFPCSSRQEVNRVFEPFREAYPQMLQYKRYYPFSGAEEGVPRSTRR